MCIELSLRENKTFISYGQDTDYAAACTSVFDFLTVEDNNNDEKSFFIYKKKKYGHKIFYNEKNLLSERFFCRGNFLIQGQMKKCSIILKIFQSLLLQNCVVGHL